MKNKKIYRSKFSREAVDAFMLNNIYENLYTSGEINFEDLSSSEKFTKALERINLIKKHGDSYKVNNISVHHVISYKNDILKEANKLKEQGKIEFANVFYAMFFEHTINGLIFLIGIRKKLSLEVIINLIRNINFDGKLTWLLALLGLPAIKKNHLLIIKKLTEDRNSFVHYKYKSQPETIDLEEEEKKSLEKLGNISKAVAYVKKYESKIMYYGITPEKIRKRLKDL